MKLHLAHPLQLLLSTALAGSMVLACSGAGDGDADGDGTGTYDPDRDSGGGSGAGGTPGGGGGTGGVPGGGAGGGTGQVVINEVAAAGDPIDWVELTNLGDAPVSLDGWTMLDDLMAPAADRAALPNGLVVPAGGFLVIDISDETLGFKIGGDEEVGLWNPAGELADSVDWEEDASPEGGSYARSPDGTGAFQTVGEPTRGGPNSDAPPMMGGGDDPDAGVDPMLPGEIVINEVAAAGDPEDWFELTNIGGMPVSLDGWTALDAIMGPPEERVALPVGTVVPPGGHVVFEASDDALGFKLGKDEELAIWDAAGNLVDSVDWEDGESPEGGSYARDPDGTGDFAVTEAPTRGESNGGGGNAAPGRVVINEVAAAGEPNDWFELHNDGGSDVDISGWTYTDSIVAEPTRATFAEGTVVPAGGFLVVEVTDEDQGFKLGGDEELGLFDADGNLVDSVDWEEGASPAGGSYARVPDGAGDFRTGMPDTRGASNGG